MRCGALASLALALFGSACHSLRVLDTDALGPIGRLDVSDGSYGSIIATMGQGTSGRGVFELPSGDILLVVTCFDLLIRPWLNRVLRPDPKAVFPHDRRIQRDLAPISESISSLDQRERDLTVPVLGLFIKLKGKLEAIR